MHFHDDKATTHSSVPGYLTLWWQGQRVIFYNVGIALARIVLLFACLVFVACLHEVGPDLQPLMQGLPLSGGRSLVVDSSLVDRNIGSMQCGMWIVGASLINSDIGR